jgi:alkanesulfonate monooxygenase SsuD/methylene tetrahydromethanopterin reductase-like flavin-dependent oxidoreductase (luciferase family)
MGPTLAAAAKAANEGGATMFTLADHFFQMEGMGRAEDPFLEGYTSMGSLAGLTQDMTLTMLVTGVTYRYPGVLVKTVTTLDVLSGGRSMFGIGAAWYEREHRALGVPYPPVAERFEMLEETLQICNQMWSDDDGPYEGKHYRLDIRLTAGYFDDPFADVDDYLRTLDRFAALGVDLINTGPHPGNPDPVGWVKRLGDEVIPRLAS